MLPYISLHISLLFVCLFPFKNKDAKYVAAFFLIVFLILLSVVRLGVGVDFYSYESYYIALNDGKNINVERGFILVSRLMDLFGIGFQGVIALYALTTIFLIVRFYSRFSRNLLMSLFLFYSLPILYLSSFNVIRQFLVVAMFAYSLKYLVNRNLFFYFFINLFAAVFIHKSAVLMLPLYFFIHLEFSLSKYLILSVAYILALQFLEVIVSSLGFSAIYLNGNFQNTGVNYLVFVFFALFLFIYYFKKSLFLQSKDNIVFVNLMFVCTLISFSSMFSNFPSAPFMRLSTFFTIALPVLIVNVFPLIKNYSFRVYYLACVLALPTVYFYASLMLRGGKNKLVPYTTFIFG
ncbi:MAG: hypothetical protein CL579_04060 [Alteromonadaceae bacterium]|jgi:hypothetical protein|nr:hypothetical protein [Alteromonadaceae bacterium]